MTPDKSEKQELIEEFLESEVKQGGEYFKSKHIAKKIGLSPSSIGVNMAFLKKNTKKLNITKWTGNSSGTTWRVTLNSPKERETMSKSVGD